MKQAIQNKISGIRAASVTVRKSTPAHAVSVKQGRIINDNLSKSLRSEKDALIFQDELENAVQKARVTAVVVGEK